MINKFLERELKQNKTNHEIFKNQKYGDLRKVKEILENKNSLQDILIEFDIDTINNVHLLYCFPYDSYDQKRIWEHFVSIEIMKKLEEKYLVNSDHDLSEEEKYILSGNIDNTEDYLKVEEVLLNRNDVLETIKNLNLLDLRLHFLIRWCKSSCLCDEISNYLREDLPFVTMVYSDYPFYTVQVKPDGYKEKHYIWEVYDYIEFNEFNEGCSSNKTRRKKVLPDIPKQKVLK